MSRQWTSGKKEAILSGERLYLNNFFPSVHHVRTDLGVAVGETLRAAYEQIAPLASAEFQQDVWRRWQARPALENSHFRVEWFDGHYRIELKCEFNAAGYAWRVVHQGFLGSVAFRTLVRIG